MSPKVKTKKAGLHLGEVAIDTGTLVLSDPVNVEELMGGLEDGDAMLVEEMRDKTQMCAALTVPTGMGDGLYPVVGVMEDYGYAFGERLGEISVIFSNPFRGTGCQEPFPHPFTEKCMKGNAK
jgi:hypothetical protein